MSCLMDIRKQFDRVIEYSQGFTPKQSNKVIKQWFKAKRFFIKDLGGFIYEYPEEVTVELSDLEKDFRLNEFQDWVERRYGLFRLSKFISDNKAGFFTNEILEDYHLEDNLVIPKGMKMLKSFKYFEENKDILTEIQNKASMIIQENKISGTLCLSVHPLDYLSSSENTHNWRSCHSLDGEYRAGNLSYMLDNSTIVCYLKSKEHTKLPRFPETVPWNNKKWRCLLFISQDKRMMFAGRPYPFAATGLLDKIRQIVDEKGLLIKDKPFGWWADSQEISRWYNNYITTTLLDGMIESEPIELSDKYMLGRHGQLRGLSEIVEDAPNSMHYNDLLQSSCYVPYYAWVGYNNYRHFVYPEFDSHFVIGAPTYCLHCGEQIVNEAESFLCYDCQGLAYDEDFLRCDCCGETIYENEGIYINDDYIVCQNCLEEQCAQCSECGEIYFKDDMEAVRDEDNTHFHWICDDCLRERRES